MIGLTALLPSAGLADSALQATKAEFENAMTLCVGDYTDASAIGSDLVAAGYEHQPEQLSATETLHWYVAGGEADITVMLRTTPHERFCAISSERISVPEALAMARKINDKLFPGKLTMEGDLTTGNNIKLGDPQGANEPCSAFYTILDTQVLWVRVGNAGQDPICTDDGTSQTMIVM